MEELVKTNVPGLMKVKDSNMVINNSEGDYNRAVLARQKGKELIALKRDVAMLKQQVQRILDVLELK